MKFVVFSQSIDGTGRVDKIIGPFSSYDNAAAYASYMRKNCNPNESVWYGIRELEKTVICKM